MPLDRDRLIAVTSGTDDTLRLLDIDNSALRTAATWQEAGNDSRQLPYPDRASGRKGLRWKDWETISCGQASANVPGLTQVLRFISRRRIGVGT